MQKKISPWSWVPTLYFAEGLPNVLVTGLAAVMYMQMGLSDAELGLYTGWLALPWVVKPLWSPFIDLLKTKRWWVLSMQLLISSALAGIAFTLPTAFWFQASMFFFFVMAFASATHDISADGFYMIELDDHRQAMFVGIRNTFYRLAVIFGNGILVSLAGVLQIIFRNRIAFTWSIIFYGLAGLFIALWLYHGLKLPRPDSDGQKDSTVSEVAKGLKKMFTAFLTKFPLRDTLFVLVFLLFYRFPEALLNTMTKTFLMRPNSSGGLGLSPQEYGLANGTIGLIGLLLGGILGGLAAGRNGLKRWLWPMVMAITLPDLVYVYLSFALPQQLLIVNCCVFIEQFGYGFGFTAYMLYLIYYSQGEHKTSHYALCTALMALSMMIPGLFAGALQEWVGYQWFFIIVVLSCVLTYVVTAFLRIDDSFGKK